MDDPSVALALAAESLTIADSEESRTAVLEVFGRFAALLSIGVPPAGTDWPADVVEVVAGVTAESPDGALLAEAEGRRVFLLDSSSGEVVGEMSLPTALNALAFDDSGRLLAAGLSEEGFADTGTTVVWNVPERREVARFDSGDGQVWSHWFDATSSSVYSYGADGIHRWDLTGSRSLVRTGSGDPTSFRAGDTLLSLWDDDVDVWLAEGCRLAGRPLTRDEWQTYVGNQPYEPACEDPRTERSTSASRSAIRS